MFLVFKRVTILCLGAARVTGFSISIFPVWYSEFPYGLWPTWESETLFPSSEAEP
jgi:hypothetical protein